MNTVESTPDKSFKGLWCGKRQTYHFTGRIILMKRKDTLVYYTEHAADFVAQSLKADMSPVRERFCSYLPQGASVLDFGCGSGRDARAFLEQGYEVSAVDGSPELCQAASLYSGLDVKLMDFLDLNETEAYDGIWACASILHLQKEDLVDVLSKIARALKPQGVLYTSFKYGQAEEMRDGRYFTDFTEEKLNRFWSLCPGLVLLEVWVTEDVRPERGGRWLNLIAKRSRT